jgi:hypothetical protein
MARRSKKGKPYVGDKILAAFHALTSCCGVSLLAVLSVSAFGFAGAASLRTEMRKSMSDPAAAWMFDPQSGIAVGILAASLAVFFLALTIGTWKSRRWALFASLVLQVAGGSLSYYWGASWTALVPNALVAFYCSLRLTGALGPKPV